MNKLTALIEAAKAARDTSSLYHVQYCQVQQRYKELSDPATILELCALLEKAEGALEYRSNRPLEKARLENEALAAIKQWKE